MSGTLIVRPLFGRLTHDTETFGRMDPYCKVTIGANSQQTKQAEDAGKNPNWQGANFSFRITNEDILNVEVNKNFEI